MPRPNKMPLTLDDVEILAAIVEGNYTSVQAACQDLGLQRGFMYRLIARVNDLAALPGDGAAAEWREDGRFRPPVEVRRLISTYPQLRQRFAELTGYPRISAGAASTLLLSAYMIRCGLNRGRMNMARRSDKVLAALGDEEIDLAIVHHSTLPELPKRINYTPLLPWIPVVARPKSSGATPARRPGIVWEAGSMGARLAMTTGTMPNDPSSVLVTSFVHGLELVRRGLVCEVSLPAIFLADDDWQTLEITPVADSSGDCLIAVYRTEESGRIAPFLEVGTWRRIVSKKALVEG